MILTRIDPSPIWLSRKLVERVVTARFMKHVDDHTLLPACQSAHSTETAIAAVNNNLIRAAYADQITALVPAAPLTQSTMTFCCQSWRGDSASTASHYDDFGFHGNGWSSRAHSVDSSAPHGMQLSRTRGIHHIHGKRRISLRSSLHQPPSGRWR